MSWQIVRIAEPSVERDEAHGKGFNIEFLERHVYFSWKWSDSWTDNQGTTAKDYAECITEATFVVRPEDWPTSITLPLQK